MPVMKFGGTSVADASRFKDVLNIVRQRAGTPVVVLSAMSGVTNGLIASAQEAQAGNIQSALERLANLRERHHKVAEELLSAEKDQLFSDLEAEFDRLSILLQGIAHLGELSQRSLDAISSCGELLSTRIFSAYALSQNFPVQYLDARQLIITTADHGRAVPLMPEIISACRDKILPLLKEGKWIITQGFIGATTSGVTTTLGRGGSDYTAALLGAAIGAEEIQIWTDVDGMMTADPRLIPEAIPIANVSFQEASELAYFGAKVLHPLTIRPAVEKNIPVRILNTLNPDNPGTLIMQNPEHMSGNGKMHTAIASKKGLTAVFIHSPRMLMASGFLAQVFNVFARYETPIDLIATSEVSISLTVDRIDQLEAIEAELKQLGEVSIMHDLAIVAIVGRQFRQKNGIAHQIFKALANVNIIMISCGASDINLSLVVSNQDADQAVKLLHNEFFCRDASR